MAYGQACAPPKGMNAGGFSTERSWHHGRAGYLACHWRSRLSCLLARAFVTRKTEPRAALAGLSPQSL